MDPQTPQRFQHPPHATGGPHSRRRLSEQEHQSVEHWLTETEEDAEVGVREHAQFLSEFPILEDAIRGSAGSALMGGFEPSTIIHAVAMLGVRRTRQLIRTVTEIPRTNMRPLNQE